MTKLNQNKTIIGWREWISLPDLDIAAVKVKVDTGALTSVLHTSDLRIIEHDSLRIARFTVHPYQKKRDGAILCNAPIIDQRTITDSGGHRHHRTIIMTRIRLGNRTWPIELSLANRERMGFRMLLGRTALRNRYIIDPSRSYNLGKLPIQQVP